MVSYYDPPLAILIKVMSTYQVLFSIYSQPCLPSLLLNSISSPFHFHNCIPHSSYVCIFVFKIELQAIEEAQWVRMLVTEDLISRKRREPMLSYCPPMLLSWHPSIHKSINIIFRIYKIDLAISHETAKYLFVLFFLSSIW